MVIKVSYEVSDDINCPVTDDAGIPCGIFATHARAEHEARGLSHWSMRGLDLQDYCNEPWEIWDGTEVAKNWQSSLASGSKTAGS